VVSFKRHFIRHMHPKTLSLWDKIDWLKWHLDNIGVSEFRGIIYGPPKTFKTTIAAYIKVRFPRASMLTVKGRWTDHGRQPETALLGMDLAIQTYCGCPQPCPFGGDTAIFTVEARILKARWFEPTPEKAYTVDWPRKWRATI